MRDSIAETALDFLERVEVPKTAKEIAKAVGGGCDASMLHASIDYWVKKGEIIKTTHPYKGAMFQLKKAKNN